MRMTSCKRVELVDLCDCLSFSRQRRVRAICLVQISDIEGIRSVLGKINDPDETSFSQLATFNGAGWNEYLNRTNFKR